MFLNVQYHATVNKNILSHFPFQPKCEKYWPDAGTKKYGDIEVTLVRMEAFADHVTRTFQLEKVDESCIHVGCFKYGVSLAS